LDLLDPAVIVIAIDDMTTNKASWREVLVKKLDEKFVKRGSWGHVPLVCRLSQSLFRVIQTILPQHFSEKQKKTVHSFVVKVRKCALGQDHETACVIVGS